MTFLYWLLMMVIPSLSTGMPGNRTRIRINTHEDQLPEINLGAIGVVANPDCDYRILQKGPDGTQLSNAIVGEDVYHEITCHTHNKSSYCLMVFNCTISSEDGSVEYDMIDEYGCTLEPLLFEHVEYHGDLKAGIRAQAIRFHNSPKVQLHCQTRLLVKGKAKCKERRPMCTRNEYFIAPAVKVITPPR